MELKFWRLNRDFPDYEGSNRTFMELKCHIYRIMHVYKQCSNRTFMELK